MAKRVEAIESRTMILFAIMPFIVMLLIMASPGACKDPNQPVSERDSTFMDPKKTVQRTVGETFSIVLDSNPTTGYQWQLANPPDEKIVKLIRSEYRASKTNLTGAGGKEIWTFVTLDTGQTAISFKYVRPWEKDKEPKKNVEFTLYVFPNIKLRSIDKH
jgi:inhibitor of cysteine peptidase